MQERLGRFVFLTEHRDVGNDKGLTIRILGPTASSQQEEVLRFDCFEKQPHYHVGFSVPPVPIEAPDPFRWTVEKLRQEFGELLRDAGALSLNANEENTLADVLAVIEKTANQEPARG
jgi:hypothetical protein